MDFQFHLESEDLEPDNTEDSSHPLQYSQLRLGDYGQLLLEESTYQLQLPSFADSTSSTTELSYQGLTQGSTLLTVFDELSSQGPLLNQSEVDSEAPKSGYDALSSPVDLRFVGEAPGQVARPPLLPSEDELSTTLMPKGYTRAFDGAPGLTSGMGADRFSSTGSSDFDWIWQAPVIYFQGVDLGSGLPTSRPLPDTVTWELKSQATTSVGLSERVALLTLDELSLQKIGAERLSLWACLWQMILIYRKVMATYAKMHPPACDSGHACLAGAATTFEEIHRLLLVKYATYFGSSSPIYHKRGHKSTLEIIAGDTRLRTAWEDVMRRRTAFYGEVSQSTASFDVITKTLIIDVEDIAEQRARRRR
ncbi:hypothetical protein N0V82_006693 [Gnomoniopsis sp. IMI 355080]|nr:hypothetical protein N0V82_006693 [Gnomoniopsis sp. IMI 355080]